MTSYLAPAPAPRQLDIIADTMLALNPKMAAIRQPATPAENGSHSSTSPKNKIGSHLSTSLKAIEARRRKLKISVQRLCHAAGIHTNTYRFALEGHAKSRPDTVEKLQRALNLLAAGAEGDKPTTICLALLRLVTADVSRKTGWDPVLMLAQDFSAENTNDPVWLQASRLRRCAIYLLVEGLFIGKAEMGHAIGISRQGIHKSVAAIEAERDKDPAFDALMQAMMVQLKGDL